MLAANRFLELPNLHMLSKQKSHHFPETWLSELQANCYSIIKKGNSALTPLFNISEMLSSASNKAIFFLKNISKNSNVDDSDISLTVFPSRTNLKLYNASVTLKMTKKVIANLDLQNMFYLNPLICAWRSLVSQIDGPPH